MTAARRPLALVSALALGLLPACLHVTATVPDPPPVAAPPPAGGKVAGLPRPGESVRTGPAAKTAAKPPADAPDPLPLPPDPPRELVAVRAEPGPLPGLGPPPAADPPLVQALRAFLDKRPDDGLRHLKALDPPQEEFALAILPVLARGSQWDLATADPAEVGLVADQLHAAAARLEARAVLKVERVLFCTPVAAGAGRVGGGRYDPRPDRDPFRVGDKAYLYVEVRHPGGGPTADGAGYLTRVNVALEVRDADGNVVEQTDANDKVRQRRVPVARFAHEDRTRGPVRDWYQTYSFGVPPKPGVYAITVEARDPAGTRVHKSRPVQFLVSAP